MRIVSFNAESARPNGSWRGVDATTERDASVPYRPYTLGAASPAFDDAALALAAIKPDLLALQEVREASGASMVRGWAKACGLGHTAFGWARRSPRRLIARATRRRGGYGIGVASRYSLSSIKVINLPSWRNPITRDPSRTRGVSGWFFRVVEARVAILAVVEAPEPYALAVTHLTTRRPDQLAQLHRLEEELAAFARKNGVGERMLLVGDLNIRLDAVEGASSLEVLARTDTYPNSSPRFQIDHVLGKGFSEGEARSVLLPVSDHRALCVDI